MQLCDTESRWLRQESHHESARKAERLAYETDLARVRAETINSCEMRLAELESQLMSGALREPPTLSPRTAAPATTEPLPDLLPPSVFEACFVQGDSEATQEPSDSSLNVAVLRKMLKAVHTQLLLAHRRIAYLESKRFPKPALHKLLSMKAELQTLRANGQPSSTAPVDYTALPQPSCSPVVQFVPSGSQPFEGGRPLTTTPGRSSSSEQLRESARSSVSTKSRLAFSRRKPLGAYQPSAPTSPAHPERWIL